MKYLFTFQGDEEKEEEEKTSKKEEDLEPKIPNTTNYHQLYRQGGINTKLKELNRLKQKTQRNEKRQEG